jgi:hypothetical protein
VNAKRRLPVFQAPANDDVPERPPWQWSVFGAGLIVLLWMVLTLLASPLMRLVAASNVASTSLHFAIEGLASLLVGTVIGTWSKRRGIKEGATAGALSALFAALCGVAVGASSGALVWEDVWISQEAWRSSHRPPSPPRSAHGSGVVRSGCSTLREPASVACMLPRCFT